MLLVFQRFNLGVKLYYKVMEAMLKSVGAVCFASIHTDIGKNSQVTHLLIVIHHLLLFMLVLTQACESLEASCKQLDLTDICHFAGREASLCPEFQVCFI